MRTFVVSLTVAVAGLSTWWSAPALAQEVLNEYQGTWHGEVVSVLEEEERIIPGTETVHTYQTIRADVLDGPKAGERITIENDFLELQPGDKFYFNYNVYQDGSESYGIVNIDRKGSLFALIGLFAFAVVAFGGWQGVRSLVALAASFYAIAYLLLPGILAGWNPLIVSTGVAAIVLFGAIFFTHGFNRESAVAFSGTILAVLLTGGLAAVAVTMTRLSGFSADESVYLNVSTGGTLDFAAILLGSIIIGVLGVLDDIAVTQAAIVTELFQSNGSLTRREVYRRALRVGREHVGALVNTLVLAYTGASLPLLLHFSLAASSFSMALNTELFATEVVRTIVGSIGLIMTVPIVTLLAVLYLRDYHPTHHHVHHHHHGH